VDGLTGLVEVLRGDTAKLKPIMVPMPKIEPFELYTEDYERWFEKNDLLYRSEINLLKHLLEQNEVETSNGIEVGVGSGRFAVPLNVPFGIDPSLAMLKIAKNKGIKVSLGVAEALPLKSKTFNFALMVTTICYVDDLIRSLKEIERILKNGGYFLVGFVDRESFLGKIYEKRKPFSKFYKPAKFYSTKEILKLTEENTTLKAVSIGQTIFGTENKLYPIKEGFGEGAFVGILFKKS
jgi:ubiquinone/menaquinone biosynthesis C-methylase UbiE